MGYMRPETQPCANVRYQPRRGRFSGVDVARITMLHVNQMFVIFGRIRATHRLAILTVSRTPTRGGSTRKE